MGDNTGAPITYADAARLLGAFYTRRPRSVAIPATLDANAGLPARLRMALANGRGDFATDRLGQLEKLIPETAQTIKTAPWVPQAAAPSLEANAPPPATFDALLRGIATLCFAIPHAGVPLSAAVSAYGDVSKSLAARAAWWREHTELPTPRDSMAAAIVNAIEADAARNLYLAMFGELIDLTEHVEGWLGRALPDPNDPSSLLDGLKLSADGHLVYDRPTLLGADGLGKVFALDKARALTTMSALNGELVTAECKSSLQVNPRFGHAAASIFLRAALALVNGLNSYAILSVLPAHAFTNPAWGRSRGHDRFDLEAAWKQRGFQKMPWEIQSVGQTLTRLNEQIVNLLEPIAAHAAGAFANIDARLQMLSLATVQSPVDGVHLRATGATVAVDWDVSTTERTELETKPPLAFVCRHFASSPVMLLRDPAIQDEFLQAYRAFNVQLTVAWAMPPLYQAIGLRPPDLVTPMTNHLLNTNWTGYHFPMRLDGAATVKDHVWWTSPDAAAPGPDQAGFLATAMGRAIIGWMAYVLQIYAARYHYDINPASGWTTATLAGATHAALASYADYVRTQVAAIAGRAGGRPLHRGARP